MTRRVAAVLALVATVTSAWPALDEKLKNYPSIHARETAKIKAGDAKTAKYVLFDAFHGLGNREQALLSSFALALATCHCAGVAAPTPPHPADEATLATRPT